MMTHILTNFTGHRVHMIFWHKHEQLIINHIVHMTLNSVLTSLNIHVKPNISGWICFFYNVYALTETAHDATVHKSSHSYFIPNDKNGKTVAVRAMLYNIKTYLKCELKKSFAFDIEGRSLLSVIIKICCLSYPYYNVFDLFSVQFNLILNADPMFVDNNHIITILW